MNMLIRKTYSVVRPRKSVLVIFAILWMFLIQHVLFIILFPDGGLRAVRNVLDMGLAALMRPLDPIDAAYRATFGGFMPDSVALVLFLVYFYLLAVIIATGYEAVVSRWQSTNGTR